MTKLEGSMGIVVSRKKRRAMAQPLRPEPLPQSQPDNPESSIVTQEDVLRSNDDENESNHEEKSEASDDHESDPETHINDEGFHETEPDLPDERSSSKSSSTKSNENVRDISDTEAKSETKTTNDTTEVDEFNSAWKKVFLEDLDIKISDNVNIVRIFTSSTFTGIIWSLNKFADISSVKLDTMHCIGFYTLSVT